MGRAWPTGCGPAPPACGRTCYFVVEHGSTVLAIHIHKIQMDFREDGECMGLQLGDRQVSSWPPLYDHVPFLV